MSRSLALVALLSWSASALAAPQLWNHQGRVMDATGVPLDGAHQLTVTLWGASAGVGDQLWTETQSVVVHDGYYSVLLGAVTPLPVLETDEVWVGIAWDGGAELPERLRIGSTPFASHAGTATTATTATTAESATTATTATNLVGGTVDATEIRVNGTVVLDGDGFAAVPFAALTGVPDFLLEGDGDTLGALGCEDGQIASFGAGSWACADAPEPGLPLTGGSLSGALTVTSGGYRATGAGAGPFQGGAAVDYTGLHVRHDAAELVTNPVGVGVAINRTVPAVSLKNTLGPALLVESGRVGVGTTTPQATLDVRGTMHVQGVPMDASFRYDDSVLFAPQAYFESGIFPWPMRAGAAPTFTTVNSAAVPFGKVAVSNGLTEFAGDFVPVIPGETLYGELWAQRAIGGSGDPGGIYYGVAQFDKDKRPIAGNTGLNYFAVGGAAVPQTGTWTKYSGTITLPTSHTPFSGSDGGAVRYVRPYIIVNYPSGTIPTQWGGVILRRQATQRDSGKVAMNGTLQVKNVEVGNTVVLAEGATHLVPGEGYFMIYRSGSPAEHHCMGIRSGNGATILISSRNCTSTANNAGTLNVYDAGASQNYGMIIQNRTGTQMTVKYTMIGAVP